MSLTHFGNLRFSEVMGSGILGDDLDRKQEQAIFSGDTLQYF